MHALKKLARDLWWSRARTLTVVCALAVGLVGFYGVLGAYGVLTREIARNYRESVPASATLILDRVSPELLNAVQRRPELAGATRRRTLQGRYRVRADSPWQRALVFVVDDFEHTAVARLFHERGALSPPERTVLLERSALSRLGGDVGTDFWLKLPGGRPESVSVSGVVHEPALAPAESEQAIYAYMISETARELGAAEAFDELRVLVREKPGDTTAIEAVAENLAAWIAGEGLGKVHTIRVPPALKHPHQSQMTAVMTLFVIFSAVVLLMTSFLAATLMSTLMARQVREIGVMKALGARASELRRAYALVILGVAALSVALAWVPGRAVTAVLSAQIAKLLNFDIESDSVPGWIVIVEIATGVLLPAGVAMPSIFRGCRVTVREALTDFGLHRSLARHSRLEACPANTPALLARFHAWVARPREVPVLFGYALRGVLRRRRHFVLSLSLLVAAGGGFIGAASIARAWDSLLGEIERTRHYDFEVRLNGTPDAGPLAERLARLSSVKAVEAWRAASVALARPGRPAIERTYPDDAHGAFHVIAPPDGARLLHVDLAEGRWLRDTDPDAVVVNQLVPGQARLRVGDELLLSVGGETRSLRVVGKAIQVGIGASAYVSAKTYDAIVPESQRRSRLWVAAAGGEGAREQLVMETERELEAAGADVESVLPVSLVKNAMAAHFEILVKALLALAGLIAVIGALGLGSAISVSVSERTRELGVLRAIGATTRQVRGTVVLEGLLVGSASLMGALIVGVAFALAVGKLVGELSFRIPLPLSVSLSAIGLWACGALALAALGSAWPAARAARRSVRDALVWLVIVLGFGATFLSARGAAAVVTSGTLTLRISGFEHDKGPVVAKLFRRGDDAPKGKGFRKVIGTVRGRRATISFSDVPWGTYAVFVFHDENGNGTVDHNFLGIPIEPLGFSANFRPSIWTGVPTFDDLKFEFNSKSTPLPIVVD